MKSVKKTTRLFAVLLATSAGFSSLASAQRTYGNYDDSQNYVTIYEHCDFRGASQTITPGEYQSMGTLRFANDSVSSVRVPRGAELIIYEDDNFRGPYARISRDIKCFDRQWNDKVSSLKVSADSYDGRAGRRSDDRYGRNDNGYEGRSYDNRARDNRRRDDRGRDNRYTDNGANVTAKNIAQLVFDGQLLQQVDAKTWRMSAPRGRVIDFKETRRDRDSVYLQNDYTAQRVRIDLFANDVTFVNQNGKQQRYNIDRKQAALVAESNPSHPGSGHDDSIKREPRLYVNGKCFNYKAYTLGGEGGVRFHGKEGFFRFSKKPTIGKICHRGDLIMEINKTKPATEVVIEIQGNKHRFAAGEKEDRYLNTWYRKKVNLIVGR